MKKRQGEDMQNRLAAAALILGTVMLLVAGDVRADEEAKKKAVAAAETWLALIDKGDIAKSWETSAALFRGAVTQEQWKQAVSGARGPLGKLISRVLLSANYETSLPGVPDGEDVIIQFKTVFENKADAVETITPMQDPDGHWRVSGYYIK